MRLPVANAASDLLEKADILEFPSVDGASSAGNFIRTLRQDSGQLGTLYMRAKAVYLLERYIEEQAITSMVVCIEPSNAKVGELCRSRRGMGGQIAWRRSGRARAADQWLVRMLHQARQGVRQASPPAEREAADWSKRMAQTLIEDFGRHHTWPMAWAAGRAFDNVHLLRNPHFRAKHLLNYGNDGSELAFKAEQKERIQRLRQDFVESAAVRRHVTDPAVIWSEAMELNDGGTTFLAQSIADVCDARAKQRHVLNDLSLLGQSLA